MKDVLNFATTMPGAPSVMMDLMNVMPMLSVVSWAILIKVKNVHYNSITPTLSIILSHIMLDATPRPAAHFGQGTGSILRQYLQCSGTESRLVDCPTSSSTCSHIEDAGVTCLPTGISLQYPS